MEDNYDLKLVLTHMERLLYSRVFPKTICPSEAARVDSAEGLKTTGASSWRDLMPAIRQHVFERRDAGELEVCRKLRYYPPRKTSVRRLVPSDFGKLGRDQ
jgi:hypothetical protein